LRALLKRFQRLISIPTDQREQYALCVAAPQEQFDDGRGSECLPVPVAISSRKRSLPAFTALCRAAWLSSVGTKKAQGVDFDKSRSFRLILPRCFGCVAGRCVEE